MSALELAIAPSDVDATPRMVHLEHPRLPGTAWCGADITGHYPPAETQIDCVVCDELCFQDYIEHYRDDA